MIETTNHAALRKMVREDTGVNLIIVHQEDGNNDFFSYLPEAEECERRRVIAICKDIIRELEKLGAPRRRYGTGPGCPGMKPGSPCPAGGADD